MAPFPRRFDALFGDALVGDGGTSDPVQPGWRDSSPSDVYPDALSALPLAVGSMSDFGTLTSSVESDAGPAYGEVGLADGGFGPAGGGLGSADGGFGPVGGGMGVPGSRFGLAGGPPAGGAGAAGGMRSATPRPSTAGGRTRVSGLSSPGPSRLATAQPWSRLPPPGQQFPGPAPRIAALPAQPAAPYAQPAAPYVQPGAPAYTQRAAPAYTRPAAAYARPLSPSGPPRRGTTAIPGGPVVAPGANRRPVAGVGYTPLTSSAGGLVRPPAYLPQNQGFARFREAAQLARRTGRPPAVQPTAVRPAPGISSRRNTALPGTPPAMVRPAPAPARRRGARVASAWGFVVLVSIFLLSTGLGEKIVRAVTELLQRR